MNPGLPASFNASSEQKGFTVMNSLNAVTDSAVGFLHPSQASLFNLAGPDLFIILFVVLLLFGAKKLPELARGLGQAVKEFSKAKDEFEREVSQPPQYNRLPETQAHDPHHGYAQSNPETGSHSEYHREEPAPVEATKPVDSSKPTNAA